jgi:carbamoyl-phosphate synthase large subunit
MKKFTVLITGAGTTNAVTVLKGLKAMGDPSLQVFMGDIEPDCAGAYLGDEFVFMPLASGPDFEERVIEICRKHHVDLVIPTIDYEFARWSSVAGELLAAGTRVIISGAHVITRCGQKDLTIQYFREVGVPCPDTRRISEIKDPSKLPFPVFVKPRCGRGSLAANRVDNLEEYLFYTAKTEDLIVQTYLQGEEVTIDTLSDLEGCFLAANPRIRVEVKSGQAYRGLTIHAPELTAYAKKIVEGMPIIGPGNIQCFLTEKGPQFTEINPRFGAGTALSINAGLNAPAALVAMAQGKPIPELKPRPNVWMLRYWQEVFVERTGWPIFFDLDGPILDVSFRHYQVYRDILEEANKPAVSFDQYWQDKRARRPHSVIVSETAGTDFYTKTFKQEWFDRIERDKYLSLDRVWPWVTDVLAELYRNHELYLITVRSYPHQLKKQLDRLNLARWFRAVLCRPARKNAGQEKLRVIRENLETLPQQAIIVGDTEADIECGKELGFVTVGVLCGIRNKEYLQAKGCDYLLDNILSLPQLVYKLSGGISDE